MIYDFENGITLFQLAKLKLKLESRLNKDIDLVSVNYISKYLKNRILGEVSIFMKPDNFARLKHNLDSIDKILEDLKK